MARIPKAKRDKVAVKAVKVDTLSTENHQQTFIRLGGSLATAAIFNAGAMHGTPQARQKKAH